jgi:hypothetical protein
MKSTVGPGQHTPGNAEAEPEAEERLPDQTPKPTSEDDGSVPDKQISRWKGEGAPCAQRTSRCEARDRTPEHGDPPRGPGTYLRFTACHESCLESCLESWNVGWMPVQSIVPEHFVTPLRLERRVPVRRR